MSLKREVLVFAAALLIMFVIALGFVGYVNIQQNTEYIRLTTARRLNNDEATHHVLFSTSYPLTLTARSP